MRRIGVAGGIGAGKTALTERLEDLGWSVVDADRVAHRVTEAGQPAWRALRDAFGDAVLGPDGSLDRTFVAEVVFHDHSALRRLNHITHGHIGQEIERELDSMHGSVAFVAIPLFLPEHRHIFKLEEVWAVLCEPETAVTRLREHRGFSEADACARLANQMTNDERITIVDRVLWNEGSLSDLYEMLDVVLHTVGVTRG